MGKEGNILTKQPNRKDAAADSKNCDGQNAGSIAEIVEAQEFVIRDKRGRRRGSLGLKADGSLGLDLCTAKGVSRARLSISADEHVSLRLTDKHGRARALLAVCHHEGPLLSLFDSAGEERVRIVLYHSGAPHFSLQDSDGKPRVKFYLMSPDGHPLVSLFQTPSERRLWLSLNPEGHLFDPAQTSGPEPHMPAARNSIQQANPQRVSLQLVKHSMPGDGDK